MHGKRRVSSCSETGWATTVGIVGEEEHPAAARAQDVKLAKRERWEWVEENGMDLDAPIAVKASNPEVASQCCARSPH